MASICNRCALRMHRAITVDTRTTAIRAFSSTTPAQKSLETFTECSNPELQSILSELHHKHFVPAALKPRDRKLIYAQKSRQLLEDNPREVTIGDTDYRLRYIDRHNDVQSRKKLLGHALNLMLKGDAKDWANMSLLLQNYNEVIRKPLEDRKLLRIIYGAADTGRLGAVIKLLQEGETTGLTLKNQAVLECLLSTIWMQAEESGWAQGATEKALRYSSQIALLLESKHHNSGNANGENDPRKRPAFLGLFLDLAATNVAKHHGGKDTFGVVRTYAQRLMSRLREQPPSPSELKLAKDHRQHEMMHAMWTWHGLHLARRVLGPQEMPEAALAEKLDKEYKSALDRLAKQLQKRDPKDSGFSKRIPDIWARLSKD